MALGKCRECDADVSAEAKTCPKCGVAKPVKSKIGQQNPGDTLMETADRLKIYQGFAELGRKWSQVMDAKAGFLSALNVALIVFVWTGAKLGDTSGIAHCLALAATAIASISLYISLMVVSPRTTLKHALGADLEYSKGYRAVSFFGDVARNYPHDKHEEFMAFVDAMDEKAFAQEALEQHYTISHIVQKKSDGVARAGLIWLLAVFIVIVALFVKW